MKKNLEKFVLTVMILFSAFFQPLHAQQQDSVRLDKEKAVRIFIDCNYCSEEYIRTEITFVNYVRDVKQAQVYILVTRQETGSGGREYSLIFMGQEAFAGKMDTLNFITKNTDTEEIIRSAMVRMLKIGLVPYVAKTPYIDQLLVDCTKEETQEEKIVDKWNSWVFNINTNAYFNGQVSQSSINGWGSFSADRVTEDWKHNYSLNANYGEDKFPGLGFSSITRSQSMWGLTVKSLTPHWSAGIYSGINSSSYSNIDLSYSASPAIEYNIFPYTESTRREFVFHYRISYDYNNYTDTTIFNKTEEVLYSQFLSAKFAVKQKWGSAYINLSGSAFLHDFGQNKLSVGTSFDVRVFKGLSINFYSDYSFIRNQVELPKGGASDEEILLRRKQQATSFSYYGSMGIRYTFGSMYNNVVNPRF